MPQKVNKFERIKTPVSDQKTLRDAGYTPFFSSNVSAGQRDDKDLFIRFHNGSVYKYPNQGKNFGDLLLSPSKGKWVWANLRRKNVTFSKVGSFPLAGDRDLTDEELFAEFQKIPKVKLPPKLTTMLSAFVIKEQTSFLSMLLAKDTLFTSGIIVRNLTSIIK